MITELETNESETSVCNEVPVIFDEPQTNHFVITPDLEQPVEFELPSYQSIDDNCEITYSLESQNPEIDLPIGFTVDTANKIEPKLVYQDVTGSSQGTFELNLIA